MDSVAHALPASSVIANGCPVVVAGDDGAAVNSGEINSDNEIKRVDHGHRAAGWMLCSAGRVTRSNQGR